MIEHKIEFVIIGGFAGVLHGSALVTQDLDLCTILTPEKIETLRQCLKDFHPIHRMTTKKLSFLDTPKNAAGLNNLYLETDLGIVDFIKEVTGVGDFKRVASQAETIMLFGHLCKIISLEDLITAKKSMGRGKDLAMVRELKVIRNKLKKE